MTSGLRLAGSLFVALVAAPAVAQPPLPPPRPAEPAKPPPSPAAEPPPSSRPLDEAAQPEEQTCLIRLREAGFMVSAAEAPNPSNALCRIDDPVRLSAVPVSNRPAALVALPGQPLLACRFAEAYGHWLGDLVAPYLAASLGSELKAVHTGPGFECRNVNRAPSGKLSAHAEGLAIDTAAFELANGTRLNVKPGGPEAGRAALDTLRRAGCGWFTTILGPGSDPSHTDHLHVDVQRHGSSDRYRICQ
ncbi:MAG: extensin family protein [Microvirga sp.]